MLVCVAALCWSLLLHYICVHHCISVAFNPFLGHTAHAPHMLPLPRPVQLAAAAAAYAGSDDDVGGSSVDGDAEDNGED